MTAEVVSLTSRRPQRTLLTESGRSGIDIPVGDLSLSDLKSVVESAMIDALLRAQAGRLSSGDSPFDPIYIADLKADVVEISALADIVAVSGTPDLSLTLARDDIDE